MSFISEAVTASQAQPRNDLGSFVYRLCHCSDSLIHTLCEAHTQHGLRVTTKVHIACAFSHSAVSDSGTPCTGARQAPLSVGFSRQEHWSGLPVASPGDLPTQGLGPHLLCLLCWQAGCLALAPLRTPLASNHTSVLPGILGTAFSGPSGVHTDARAWSSPELFRNRPTGLQTKPRNSLLHLDGGRV